MVDVKANEMNVLTQLIKHSEASKELLEKIATFKSIRWQYPLENQLQWMKDNLESNDIHLLVYQDDKLIAYTNFVDIEVVVNKNPTKCMGIGNVCTVESGKSYGNILMNAINNSITQNNWNGILMCKESLVSYYEKFDWILANTKKNEPNNLNIMTYNFYDQIGEIEYFDRNF